MATAPSPAYGRGTPAVRLRHQVAATGDPVLQRLHDELAAYPYPDDAAGDGHALVVPLRLRTGEQRRGAP